MSGTRDNRAAVGGLKDQIKQVLREVRTSNEVKSSNDRGSASVQHIRIKQLLSRATPAMIAQAEQELVSEGFTQADLTSACDAHLELFREAAGEQTFNLPADHPISHFETDHRVILRALADLRTAIASARSRNSLQAAAGELIEMQRCVDLLLAAENHNVRQENTLFPILERHGIEQPPAIMWQEHTDMRRDKKTMAAILSTVAELEDMLNRLDAAAIVFTEKFAAHTQKETRILYPASLELFSEAEWQDIKEECDNLGYFTDSTGDN
ncbi:MAG TPA: DUF438 domain-containing protein [Spirochaetia bacterium]|nr:DUF438 domain-containing protein [Spirochaetia bacterium]